MRLQIERTVIQMDLWFTENHSDSVRFSIRVDKQLYSEQSEYQRIDVFQSLEFGRLLALDGYVMITQKDEFIYHDMIVHVPMAVKKDIKNVLVIGAGDGRYGKGAVPLQHDRAYRPCRDRQKGC